MEANCTKPFAPFLVVPNDHWPLLPVADAHQQGLNMIPLLMERDYKPNGWLVRLPALVMP